MKNVKTLLLRTLTTISVMLLSVTPTLASGGTDPYNPYGPHTPVPTGLGNIETIALIGAMLYVGGVVFITFSNILKTKFAK